ncbi:MAG: peptidoglycan-binding protein [Patescibacteria group bacterium]
MFRRSLLIALVLISASCIGPLSSSAALFDRPLTLGSVGPDVSALQTILKEKGFYQYPVITGYYGPITSQAVADYQRSTGLESVGSVGPATRALLNGGNVSSPSVTLASIISTLQRILKEHGYYKGAITGTLDMKTLRAVESIETNSSPRERRGGGGGNNNNEVADTTAPTLSSITSSPSDTSATITWTTDETSDSQVEYGATSSYGATTTLDTTLTTSHSVSLTSLSPSTVYHFRVLSRDAAGNLATSSDQTLTTTATPDTTAPVISSIASSTTETTATISWTTDEAATSVVNYGATASYGSASSSATLVTSHSIELTGLTAATTYHFQVQSLDSAGNTATSSDRTFTTDSAAVVLAVDRPTVALDEAWNLWGDSTTFGVGAPTGEDYPQKLRDIVASGVSSISCSSGTSGNMGTKSYVCNNGIAGENTGTISGRVSTLAAGANAAEMARPQIFSGGLNNFNTAVTGWSRDWPAQVKADFATEIAQISGGRDYAYLLAPATDDGTDGMQQGASHVFNRRDMIATYGRHVIDMQRYLRDYPQPGTGTDYFSTYTDGALPTSLRGSGGVAVTYSDAQPLTGAGTPSDLAAADMQPYWDTTNRRLYRKVGASGTGSWDLVDRKHFSAAGNERIARMVADFMMASQGDGPPFVGPQEYLITSNIAGGATVGQLVYTGTSTAFYLTNTDGSEQSLYTISNTGLIERSGTGTLDVGVETYTVWAANAHGMLSSAVDIYVDKPAAAAPQKFDITGSGAALYGRESHAFPSGTKISGAFLVKVSSFSDSSYLMNFSKGIGDSTFLAQINTSGRIRFVGNTASSTLAINATTAAGVTVPLNTWTWVLFSIDLAAPSAQVYINDTAATLSTTSFTSSLNFADMTPRFLSVREPQLYDDGLSVVKGGLGPVVVFPDYVDWSTEANRRALFDASGNPATRTPFSDVGGKSPYFDTSSGLGGFLWGTSDPDNAQSLLVPSFRARNLFTPAS